MRVPAERDAELFEVELEGGGGVIAEDLPAGLLLPDHGSPAQSIAMVRARTWVSGRAGCLPGPLLGRIDAGGHGLFYGWALDEARPWRRVALEIVINGQVFTATMAAHRREDLVRALRLAARRADVDLRRADRVRRAPLVAAGLRGFPLRDGHRSGPL
jgi:hypothetical protein